jgi:hypothetical protein
MYSVLISGWWSGNIDITDAATFNVLKVGSGKH